MPLPAVEPVRLMPLAEVDDDGDVIFTCVPLVQQIFREARQTAYSSADHMNPLRDDCNREDGTQADPPEKG